MKDKINDIFIEGALSSGFIGERIASHQSKTGIGGHSIFLGQVRADVIGDKAVQAIEFSAYNDMANKQMALIREELITRFHLSCLHVYHSLGRVEAGAICLFAFTSAPHRAAAIEACSVLVERIKAELPIWGRELFTDQSHQWKINQPK